MRRERTDNERLTDSAILLTLWAQAQEHMNEESVGDRLKLMKLAFLATYNLYSNGIKGLNLRFQRYTYGPYTEQVSDNWADLSARGMLAESELFSVTEEGMRFAHCFNQEVIGLKQNEPIRETINMVVDQYADLETSELLTQVYKMWCYTLDSPGKKHEVDKIKTGREFTAILNTEEAEKCLYLPTGWQTTLDLTFDPFALRNLQRGIEDMHKGQLYGLEALGSDV